MKKYILLLLCLQPRLLAGCMAIKTALALKPTVDGTSVEVPFYNPLNNPGGKVPDTKGPFGPQKATANANQHKAAWRYCYLAKQ